MTVLGNLNAAFHHDDSIIHLVKYPNACYSNLYETFIYFYTQKWGKNIYIYDRKLVLIIYLKLYVTDDLDCPCLRIYLFINKFN